MDSNQHLFPEDNSNDKLSTGLWILSFIIPLAGAIIYFTQKTEHPQKARSACHAALYGIGFGIVLRVILTVAGGDM